MTVLTGVGLLLVCVPAVTAGYAYLLYPAGLWLLPRRRRPTENRAPDAWPTISISVPVYNEAESIGDLLESLLGLDYPADRRQILVISDASTDGTEEIVESYQDQGVELLRLSVRRGKTAAETAGAPALRGDIVVNTDATVRIDPGSLRPLIRQFRDPHLGLASGRDVSVGSVREATPAESGYVGYEMWVRSLETRVGSIVGASGCFYAIRAPLHRVPLPDTLSRDFAAALHAREHGYRAVSVEEAVCYVPRTTALAREYRRKVRTMTRGLQTLWFKRPLLNPFRFGGFAVMLASHKLARWAVPLSLPLIPLGGVLLLPGHPMVGGAVLAASAGGLLAGLIGRRWPENRPVPRVLATLVFGATSLLAGVNAWHRALRGEDHAVWEPTRRPKSPAESA